MVTKNEVPVEKQLEKVMDEGQEAVKSMRRAAKTALKLNSSKIAKGLANKATDGNAVCAKLLCDLANGSKQGAKKKKKKYASQATALGDEPEWCEAMVQDEVA